MDNGMGMKRHDSSSMFSAVSMESLDNCSTISSNGQQSQVRTIFVSGLPLDVKARELYLLFRSCQGYESSQLKASSSSITSKAGTNGITKPISTPIGFVTFASRQDTEEAIRNLQGVRFDPDSPITIRLEFARSNTKVAKPRQSMSSPGSTSSNATFLAPSIIPHTLSVMNGMPTSSEISPTQNLITFAAMQHQMQDGLGSMVNNMLPSSLLKSGSAYEQPLNSQFRLQSAPDSTSSQFIGFHHLSHQQQQLNQAQAIRQILVATAANQQQQQSAVLATYMAAQAQQAMTVTSTNTNSSNNHNIFASSIGPTNGNGTPPCSTLFIANLGSQPDEDELHSMFRIMPGFSRLRMHSKGTNSVAFVEFQTIEHATSAMHCLQGRTLTRGHGSKTIRIEYARTKMSDGSNHNQQQCNGQQQYIISNGITSAV